MRAAQWLDDWHASGLITAEQHAALGAVVRKERFSVFLELNAALYVGVLAIAAGLGWTVYDHFANAGDVIVVAALTAIFGGCLGYCFTRDERSFAFDYVLYLGCLTIAVLVAYVEFRFHLLKQNWDAYLLGEAVLYFALAYRFDNRFVLSLALSTLAGWFGVRLSAWQVFAGSVRNLLLVYGALVAAAGVGLHRAGIKPHFLDAYLHVGANAVLAALASGAMLGNASALWVAALVSASIAAIAIGARFGRFAFVVYGFLYGYVGVSANVVREVHGDSALLAYFVVSALGVVGTLVMLARRGAAR